MTQAQTAFTATRRNLDTEQPVIATTPKIEVNNLNFFYGKYHALKNINLRIPANKVTAFIGPSGCGKSTLLRTFNQMYALYPEQRAEGEIMMDGENLLTAKQDISLLRARVGMVFQKPTPFPMSIYDNIAFGVKMFETLSRSEMDDRVEWALTKAALWTEAATELLWPVRRSAATPVYRPWDCDSPGSAVARRTVFGTRPDFDRPH